MYLKKITTLALSSLMIMSFSACKSDETARLIKETESVSEYNEIYSEFESDIASEEVTTDFFSDESATVTSSEMTEASSETTSAVIKDYSGYSTADIVEAYKNAAIKSHSSVTSQHSVEITNIIINGEELGSGFDFIKKIVNSFISNNTEDSQGITGGYKNLTEADVSSAKIYKDGKNTVIEMTMKNQTDGAKSDIHSGSVGHAIDVVGDISVVTDELSEMGLPIEISADSTTINYTKPVVKVVIDENGKIIKGTWSYTVEIRLKDYKAFGTNVESSSIVMNNTITVNGGF